MSGKKGITAEELLKIPEVQEATGSVSRELVQRRRSQPAVCDVFNHPFTALKTENRYRFEIDREGKDKVEQDIDLSHDEKQLQTLIDKMAIELCQGDSSKSSADGDS